MLWQRFGRYGSVPRAGESVLSDLEQFFRDFLNPADCGCRLYERCPYCGSAETCIQFCAICEAEWPAKAKTCPNCEAAKRVTSWAGEISNPRPCPLHGQPRPWAPPCEHMREAFARAELVAAFHKLTLEQLVACCLAINADSFHHHGNPDTYAEPAQLAAKGKRSHTQAGRISTLGGRVRAGVLLRHPDDWYIGKPRGSEPQAAEQFGQAFLHRLRNGGNVRGNLTIIGGAEKPLTLSIPNEVDHGDDHASGNEGVDEPARGGRVPEPHQSRARRRAKQRRRDQG
ncbi:MAG: hypothetical protein KGL39_08130 [Patescibacteria group bacterium]|nr:hypothetical protein [Patescibacteria group bacterium]